MDKEKDSADDLSKSQLPGNRTHWFIPTKGKLLSCGLNKDDGFVNSRKRSGKLIEKIENRKEQCLQIIVESH